MRKTLCALVLLAAVPAGAAQLKILQPVSNAGVSGIAQIKVHTIHEAGDKIYADPDVLILDETGSEKARLIAVRDPKTQVCTATFDSRKLADGVYQMKVVYKTLAGGKKPTSVEETSTFGVRNQKRLIGKVVLDTEAKAVKAGESAEVQIRVLDTQGLPIPGVRVALKVDRGEVSSDAEITDQEGEALVSVDFDEAGPVMLVAAAEGTQPVVRTITFK